MKEAFQHARRFAAVCGILALLGLAGCQRAAVDAAASVSLDTTTQALMQFVEDFARQALAAYLF